MLWFVRYIEAFVLLCLPYVMTMNYQSQFIVKLENSSMTNLNVHYADGYSTVTKINESYNVLNCTLKFKFYPDATMLNYIKAYRITKNNQTIRLVSLVKTFKDIIEMETFDTNIVWTQYTRPPLYWPPIKDVTYKTFGWAPDSTRFPPNLPAGKIRAEACVMLKNKTMIYCCNYLLDLVYKK